MGVKPPQSLTAGKTAQLTGLFVVYSFPREASRLYVRPFEWGWELERTPARVKEGDHVPRMVDLDRRSIQR